MNKKPFPSSPLSRARVFFLPRVALETRPSSLKNVPGRQDDPLREMATKPPFITHYLTCGSKLNGTCARTPVAVTVDSG